MSTYDVNYPLRIGVTGHRSLSDEDAIAKAVERVLEYVEETLHRAGERSGLDRSPILRAIDTVALTALRPVMKVLGLAAAKRNATRRIQTSVDWTVISPLATGADRIVARSVLAKPGAKLRVVLPFHIDEYRKDFRTSEDLGEFDGLLQLGVEPIVLDESSSVDWTNQQLRSQAYFNGGRYVADSSELLIAIWDGKPAAGLGGTGDVVRHAIASGKRVIWIDSNQPNRPPCMIVPDQTFNEPFAGARVTRLPDLAKYLSLGFHRLAAYNRDPIVSDTLLSETLDREASSFGEVASKSGLPVEATQQICQHLLPLYIRADLAAVAYQRLYQFGAKSLFRLSAFSVSIAVLQVLFFPTHTWIIAFEVLAMLTAVLLHRVSVVEAWHEKWLNDRHLAEWLRSAMFTSFLGKQKGLDSEVSTLPFYNGPDQWFVESLQEPIDRVRSEMPGNTFTATKSLLVDEWIDVQAKWHKTNAERKHRLGHAYHVISTACFWATLVMATLHMFGVGHGDHASHQATANAASQDAKPLDGDVAGHPLTASAGNHHESNRLADVSLWISFFAIILPAWGAATHGIATLLEYDRLATRSQTMAEQLNKVVDIARRATNLADLTAAVEKAEAIMAAENQEWFASLMFRKLEVVA